MEALTLDQRVRAILASEVRLKREPNALAGSEDLFELGMDSHGAVRVMLALEDALGIEFAEDRLTRATFSTIDAMVEAIGASAPPA